jgi:hypothetical protein
MFTKGDIAEFRDKFICLLASAKGGVVLMIVVGRKQN